MGGNDDIVLTFSEPITSTGSSAQVELRPDSPKLDGAVSVLVTPSVSGVQVTLDPGSTLVSGQWYTMVLPGEG